MIQRKLEPTRETCTCNCETNKRENNLSTNDKEEKKKAKTDNSYSSETVNAHGVLFIIYGCGGGICTLVYVHYYITTYVLFIFSGPK